MKLFTMFLLACSVMFAQGKPTAPIKPPAAKAAAPLKLTDLESSHLQIVLLQRRNNEQEKTILSVTLQFLHDQICTAHEVDVKSCKIAADGKSISVQPPPTKEQPPAASTEAVPEKK